MIQPRFYLILLAMLLSGCAAIGPSHVERDRIEYNMSVTDSWKRQILLNIVKIRYVEPLFFMDLGEIVTAYSLETGGSIGASRTMFDHPVSSDSTLLELGGTVKYTDRPTITYRPLTGPAFFRGIMSPMPLPNVLMSIESGASARFFLRLGVRSINGLHNETSASVGYHPADPRFARAVEIIADLQAANALHVTHTIQKPGVPPCPRLTFGGHNVGPETIARIKELQGLLSLDTGETTYALGFGSTATDSRTIMLQTYSLAQVLAAVSRRVDMPVDDVRSHRAVPGMPTVEDGGLFEGVMVRSSKTEPKDAFVSIRYRDSWFWVDDHDIAAKKVFSFLMLAFTLMDKGQQDTQLQLTVPTQ